MRSAFIYSDRYSMYRYPGPHPFDLRRVDRLYEVLKEHNLLDRPEIRVVKPSEIPEEPLLKAHDADYVDLLRRANKGEVTLEMLEHGLGTEDCPIMKGIYDLHALAAGATFKAVQMVDEDEVQFAFNPMGGFHHARRSQAAGFCYFNDVNIAICHLLENGRRVAYVDLDAHHGDGVQDAFYLDDRVLVISIHESGKYLFPSSGFETETGAEQGKGYNINIPLEKGTDDEVYFYAFNEVVPPLFRAFQPDLVIGLLGADILANDPVAHLHMTNNVMADVAVILDHISPRWVCLGAGGYNLENTARAWALAWAVINGFKTQEEDLATLGGVFLGDSGIGIKGLRDMHVYTSGPEKEKAYKEVDRILDYLKKNVFPILGVD
jgi:acetoin utilization protein AcuC